MWGSGSSSSHTSLQHLNAQQHIYRRQKLRALGKAQTSRASLICLGIAGGSAGKGTDLGSFTPHLCEAKGMGFPGGCQHVRFILELTHSKGRALQFCHETSLLKPSPPSAWGHRAEVEMLSFHCWCACVHCYTRAKTSFHTAIFDSICVCACACRHKRKPRDAHPLLFPPPHGICFPSYQGRKILIFCSASQKIRSIKMYAA